MKEKCTPGPWKAEKNCIKGPQDEPLALLATSAKQEANAALIAAAPDLLDVCKRVSEWLEETHVLFGDEGAIQENEKLKRVIAKATGEPQ